MLPISLGDRGDAVADVQRRLQAAGYAVGPSGVDGVFAEDTRRAVLRFQSERGLEESGVVDEKTWRSLVEASVRLGDRLLYLRTPFFRGDDVRELQERLNTLGFHCGEVDGLFGRMTERAVRDFQKNSGLPSDGIVGEATLAAMEKLKNILSTKSPSSLPRKRPRPFSSAAVFKDRKISITRESEESLEDSVCTDLSDRLQNLLELLGASVVHRVVEGSTDVSVSFRMRQEPAAGGFSVEAIGDESVGLAESIYSQLSSSISELDDGGMIVCEGGRELPAAVVYPGSSGSTEELRLLGDEAFAQKLAVGVFDGLHDYFRRLREAQALES